jgi:AraC family transcriptional regulator, transcriptional activator of pobA
MTYATSDSAKRPAVTRRRQRPVKFSVPRFALYGERAADQGGNEQLLLHVEDIQSRSRLYRWEIDAHVHSGLYQLICVSAGPIRISLDDVHTTPRAPVVVVVPPGAVHAFHMGPDTEGYVLSLSARWLAESKLDELGEAFRTLFAKPRVIDMGEHTATMVRVRGLLGELLAEFSQPDGATSPVTGWLARAVVWRLSQSCAREHLGAEGSHRHHDVFSEFRTLIERHYLDHWPLNKYAQALNLSVERLNRLCKQVAGVSAFELIQDRLVREACRRLIYVAVPVTQLAYELGFADPGYFCRFFKRRSGCTPNEYRNKHSTAEGMSASA